MTMRMSAGHAIPAYAVDAFEPRALQAHRRTSCVLRTLEHVARPERTSPFRAPERYLVGELLNQGAVASIHRAEQRCAEGVRIPVAIKRFSVPGLDATLAREALILAPILHSNIIAARDFVVDAHGRASLILELVDGVSLARLIGTGRIGAATAVSIAVSVLAALEHLHDTDGVRAAKIVHRQVSAEHVLLSWSGAVKLTGFGRATCGREGDAPGSPLVRRFDQHPTMPFGFPVDHRTDLRAVGELLWMMLTGRRRPLSEPSPVWTDWLRAQAGRAAGESRLPDDLGYVVLRLLDPDPIASYASAFDAEHALARCLEFPLVGCDAIERMLRERFAAEAPARRRFRLAPPHSGTRLRPRTNPVANGQRVLAVRKRSSVLRLIGLTLIAVALGVVLGRISRTCAPPKACRVGLSAMSRSALRALSSSPHHGYGARHG